MKPMLPQLHFISSQPKAGVGGLRNTFHVCRGVHVCVLYVSSLVSQLTWHHSAASVSM